MNGLIVTLLETLQPTAFRSQSMGTVRDLVLTNLKEAPPHQGLRDLLFGPDQDEVRRGRPVVSSGEERHGVPCNHEIQLAAWFINETDLYARIA
jgi:hypothetical protein